MTINKHNKNTSKENIEKLKSEQNKLPPKNKENIYPNRLLQLNKSINYILFAAMILSFLVKKTTDALIILSALVFKAIIELIQKRETDCVITDIETAPLQKKLKELSRFLCIYGLAACVVLFCIELLRGREVFQTLITTLLLAVAVIPEGLPVSVAVVLVLGMQRLAKQNAVIKKTNAVEALGSVNVICVDKTGIITQNKTRVAKLYFNNKVEPINKLTKEEHELLIHGFTLCNDANKEKEEICDSTEVALLNMSSVNKKILDEAYPRIDKAPFTPERRLLTTVHEYKGKKVVFSKGLAEILLDKCTSILIDGHPCNIKSYISEIKNKIKEMSSEALRVIALAYKEKDNSDYESGLTLVGFVGLVDTPKKEVETAVIKAQEAGIKVIMLTDDNSDVAYAIAKITEICDNPEQVIDAAELLKITEDELKEKISNYRVFSNVCPDHKTIIVKAFQAAGNTVLLTSNDVNDALTLETSDIGAVMKTNGKDTLIEAASMVVLDSELSTLVKAVDEGKNIYDNIKKFIRFSLSGNLGKFLSMFFAAILNIAAPLKAVHLLYTYIVTDTLTGIALGMEKKEPDVVQNRSKNESENLFSNGGLTYIILTALLSEL